MIYTDNNEEILNRATPRTCSARQVSAFNREDVISRLFQKKDIHDDFIIVEQLASPSAESSFDVCKDDKILYVSVMFWEAGEYFGTGLQSPNTEGTGNSGIEVLFCPYGDRLGYLQFGAGPGENKWFSQYWPYRDGRENLAARPKWDVDFYFEKMGGDCVWICFMAFPLSCIKAVDYDGPIGFNVMRTQMRTAENSSWSYAAGNGFADGMSSGWLYLDDSSASSEKLCISRGNSAPAIQGTYDFPDEMVGGPYTPDVMRHELQYLKQNGMSRIYWIDYPYSFTPEGKPVIQHANRDFYEKTKKAFGGDPLPVCIELAHKEGLEFFTTFKPYDSSSYADPFIKQHPEWTFRRNPEWKQEINSNRVTEISLFADNADELPFNEDEIAVFCSDDNIDYKSVITRQISNSVVTRPRYKWTPAGKKEIGGTEIVRRITLADFNSEGKYWAIRFPKNNNPGSFGNQTFLLMEVTVEETQVPVTISFNHKKDGVSSTDGIFGFDFVKGSGPACWIDISEGIEIRKATPAGSVFGFHLGQNDFSTEMLDPSFPEVREHWLDLWVRRAIDLGADGVDVRIAHHHVNAEWLSYGYADPVLTAFKEKTGRSPDVTNEDFAMIRKIRGEFHTQFLREAKEMLSASGLKLEAHVEARMKASAELDSFLQIYWDVAGWIDNGIIDGINLKYVNPFSQFAQKEILPRAKRHNIPVHMISAVGDPRSNPRTPEYASEKLAICNAAGINGLNLYELWVYLRTTPRGEWFTRGCADATIKQLKQTLTTIKNEN